MSNTGIWVSKSFRIIFPKTGRKRIVYKSFRIIFPQMADND